MRRWLCAFLMIWLPLQMSWAVAAGYCQHEQGAGARHLGHHEHRHAAAKVAVDMPGHQDQGAAHAHPHAGGDSAHDAGGDSSKDTGSLQKIDGDPDCAGCHLGTLQPLTSEPATPLIRGGAVWVAVLARGHASHVPDGLERPDRRLAA